MLILYNEVLEMMSRKESKMVTTLSDEEIKAGTQALGRKINRSTSLKPLFEETLATMGRLNSETPRENKRKLLRELFGLQQRGTRTLLENLANVAEGYSFEESPHF